MITIEIETDNDAFGQSAPARRHEVARILKNLASKIEQDMAYDDMKLRDINGNTVGKYHEVN